MTQLRRRVIEDFQIRQYASGTQRNYLHCVARFAQHFGQSVGTKEKRPASGGLAAASNHS